MRICPIAKLRVNSHRTLENRGCDCADKTETGVRKEGRKAGREGGREGGKENLREANFSVMKIPDGRVDAWTWTDLDGGEKKNFATQESEQGRGEGGGGEGGTREGDCIACRLMGTARRRRPEGEKGEWGERTK